MAGVSIADILQKTGPSYFETWLFHEHILTHMYISDQDIH